MACGGILLEYQTNTLTVARVVNSNIEVADWERKGPNKMIILNALRVLKAIGSSDRRWKRVRLSLCTPPT